MTDVWVANDEGSEIVRGAHRAAGMVGEKLTGALDLIGQGSVGERFRTDQVIEDLLLLSGTAGRQLRSSRSSMT